MPVSEEYLDYVVDQLGCIGEVAAKRMFGGVGLYRDGLFFGLIAGDTLYFKVDDENRPDYEAAGAKLFSHTAKSLIQWVTTRSQSTCSRMLTSFGGGQAERSRRPNERPGKRRPAIKQRNLSGFKGD